MQPEFTSDGQLVLYVAGFAERYQLTSGDTKTRGGLGVYWADSHPNNLSIRMLGKWTTIDQATIWAALAAIRQATVRGYQSVVIRTEHELVARSVHEWMPRWKADGWVVAEGWPVRNRADFQALDEAMSQMASVIFQIVHGDKWPATQAKQLAVDASHKQVPPLNPGVYVNYGSNS